MMIRQVATCFLFSPLVLTSALFASEASGAHAEEAGSSSGLFQLDPGVSIWTIVVFAFLLVLLKKFAWGPILSSIDEREKNLRESLDKAKEAQNETKRVAGEQSNLLAEAKLEAANLIKEAKSIAEDASQKIKTQAQQEKQKILDSGLKEIEAAKAEAIAQIKGHTSQLAISVAEKLISHSLSENDHRAYVDKLIEELDQK